ncbi:uncharacterized protein LOC130992441 [Salvia miltiorrhiza]|uniref:uncharacterized protein LOC130992441 n=1 Tax=Salvia miltiorrhiza TaxID=226208 RepID=UPI0025AC5898|nr:uncharacterized protein LOC130992441 [Salvia miltiorrhiza]
MSSKQPQMLMKSTLHKTKKFFTKTPTNSKIIMDEAVLPKKKEWTRARKWSSAEKQEDDLAQKIEDLEMMMMELNDWDHALDVEEALHYYSRLTCPAYVQIVDQFFMDMYSEFHASMRKLAPHSNYSSMRSLAPLKL